MVIPAGCAWLATIILLSFPGWMLAAAVTGWLCAIGAILLALPWSATRLSVRFRSVLIGVALSSAAIALVAGAAAAKAPERRPEILADAKWLSDATAVTTQTAVTSSRFFAATLSRVDGQEVSVPVLVFGGAPAGRTEIGTTISVSGSLMATPDDEDVSYLVFARGRATRVAPPPWYLGWANGLRASFSAATASLPGYGGELLPGLAIGDTVNVSATLSADMKTSSLSHLTAVSGANCAVLIGLILLVGRAIGLRRGVRIVLASVVLVGFVVLVTPQPSVLRSAIMAVLVLAATAGGRPIGGLAVVGVTVLALLVADPWLAVEYGFALSVLATVGLMTLTAPLARRLERIVPRWLALVIAVPLAAQLACQPVLVLLSPSLPLYGVLANALAEPASPLATVVGLVACVLLPLAPPIGHALTAVAWLPSAWIAAVAEFFADLPAARVPWPGGFAGAIILAIVTATGLVALLAHISVSLRGALLAAGVALLVGSVALGIAVPGIGVPATAEAPVVTHKLDAAPRTG